MSIERMGQHLVLYGELKSKDFEEILDEAIRNKLEAQLQAVGLKLVHNAYRNSYGIRLADDPNPLRENEVISNIPLNSDHAAMIAILWIKLVGPKRVNGRAAEPVPKDNDRRQSPDAVHVNAIAQEFKAFFSRPRVEMILTTLAKARIITRTADWVQAGHNLETAVDGSHMSALIRDSVILMEIMDRAKENANKNVHLSETDRIANFMQDAGTALSPAQIQQATSIEPSKVAASIRKLRQQNLVAVVGEKPHTRYQWAGA